MISAKRCIIDFDRKFDRFTSGGTTSLRLVDKLALLNEALDIYVEHRTNLAEFNDKVKNDLRALEVKEYSLKAIKNTDKYTLFERPKQLYKILRRSPLVYKEGCGEKIVTAVSAQADDLELMRKNYWKSSYEWEILLVDEGKEGIYAWHDGQFKIKKFIIDYYEKPPEIHAPSLSKDGEYVDWNGKTQTKDKDLVLTDYSYRIIIDVAVLLAKAYVGDYPDYKLELDKILNIEKINY